VAEDFRERMPEGTVVTYSQDKSDLVRMLLGDLQNHVLIAVILVFIVILYALSGRSSIIIGLAIPASFLMGIFALAIGGYTVNIVVLFSLILAVGMLVDDAIIVTEYAERRMSEGMERRAAFELAAHRMAGPVIAATSTRIAAFSPLLFWPGIVGEFMKYLPITLIVTLTASLIYALIFAPTIGAMFAKAHVEEAPKPDGWYMAIAKQAIAWPKTTLILAVGLLVGVQYSYSQYGAGVEFFPEVEPDYGLMYVSARGNLSLEEMDRATRQAEDRLLGWPGITSVYTRVGQNRGGMQQIDEDVVGVIQYEFVDWRERKPASEILDDLRAVMADIPGIEVEVRVPEAGPPTGQAIQARLSAVDPTGLDDTARRVAARLADIPGAIDISDGLPPPGVDWALKVDRGKAAQYGISPSRVGTVVQLVTTGLKLSDYRPAGAEDAVDIRLRLPEDRRTLATLDHLLRQPALPTTRRRAHLQPPRGLWRSLRNALHTLIGVALEPWAHIPIRRTGPRAAKHTESSLQGREKRATRGHLRLVRGELRTLLHSVQRHADLSKLPDKLLVPCARGLLSRWGEARRLSGVCGGGAGPAARGRRALRGEARRGGSRGRARSLQRFARLLLDAGIDRLRRGS
jgi:multidrug efflux pump